MNKKYQVFVSSTFEDLKEERAEVIKALLEMDCIPCGMEFFPAANEDSWSFIEKLIKECDYYIVIVAGRYGSMTDEGLSYTEKEYECAIKNGIPAIAFIHASPEELPAKKTERNTEGQKKLEGFIRKLQTRLCCMWKTREELNSRVVSSMYKLMKSTPRIGWVPANLAADPNDLLEKARLINQIQELKDELAKYKNIDYIPDSNLASGEDIFDAVVSFEERNLNGYKFNAKEIKIAWDDIFRMISPAMANGCTVEHLDNTISNFYEDCFEKYYKHEFTQVSHFPLRNIRLALESLNTIKAQFMALGLIRADEGKANSNGKWYLTNLGRQKMIQLTAVRKK